MLLSHCPWCSLAWATLWDLARHRGVTKTGGKKGRKTSVTDVTACTQNLLVICGACVSRLSVAQLCQSDGQPERPPYRSNVKRDAVVSACDCYIRRYLSSLCFYCAPKRWEPAWLTGIGFGSRAGQSSSRIWSACRGEVYTSAPKRPERLWSSPNFPVSGYRYCFPREKRETDYLPSSRAERKEDCYTSTSTMRPYGVQSCKEKLYLYFALKQHRLYKHKRKINFLCFKFTF